MSDVKANPHPTNPERRVSVWRKLRIWGFRGVWNFLKRRLRENFRRARFARNLRRHPVAAPERGITLIADFLGATSLSKTMRDLLFALHDSGIPFQALQMNEYAAHIRDEATEQLLTDWRKFRIGKYGCVVVLTDLPLPKMPGIRQACLRFWEFESGLLEYDSRLVDKACVIGMSDFNVAYFRRILPPYVAVRKLLYPFRFRAAVTASRTAVRQRLGLGAQDFVVFFNFDYGSSFYRKNPDGAMRAFARAFAGCPDARLVFKTNKAASYSEAHVGLRRLAEELGIADRFLSVDDYLSTAAVYELTAACDIYLSLHRGEGFGLGIAEAMYLGCAVVATDYSANTEFCKPENSFPVPCRLVAVSPHLFAHPCYADVRSCAEPDIEAAADILRRCYADRALGARIGETAKRFIRAHFSSENFKRSVDAFLDDCSGGKAGAETV